MCQNQYWVRSINIWRENICQINPKFGQKIWTVFISFGIISPVQIRNFLLMYEINILVPTLRTPFSSKISLSGPYFLISFGTVLSRSDSEIFADLPPWLIRSRFCIDQRWPTDPERPPPELVRPRTYASRISKAQNVRLQN